MMNYTKYIVNVINQQPENKILKASNLYSELFHNVPELTYYKTLERMCKQGTLVHLSKGLYYRPKISKFGNLSISEKEIINHYTKNGKGIVVGYRLYNQKGLTTQISKRVTILSSILSEQRKNIGNVCIINSGITLTKENIPIIETMEILQNYKYIEEENKNMLAIYMKDFVRLYSDKVSIEVIKKRKYKKSTIAFLASFLNYLGVENTLNQFLSSLSIYKIPKMEEFYEST